MILLAIDLFTVHIQVHAILENFVVVHYKKDISFLEHVLSAEWKIESYTLSSFSVPLRFQDLLDCFVITYGGSGDFEQQYSAIKSSIISRISKHIITMSHNDFPLSRLYIQIFLCKTRKER